MNSRIAYIVLAVGGALFIAGGPLHPSDDGHGNKVEQLHEALVQSTWVPSHLLLLGGFIGFAVGALTLRKRAPKALMRVVVPVAIIGVIGMAAHTLQFLNADNLAAGDPNAIYYIQVLAETVVNAAWAVAFALLALIGGFTRSVGNVFTGILGSIGGAAFALASATIAFVDTFDPLFPVSVLLGLWAITIGTWFAMRMEQTPVAAH